MKFKQVVSKIPVANLIAKALLLYSLSGIVGCAHSFVLPPSLAPCADQFWQGIRPQITIDNLKKSTQYLCFDGFALMHSGVSKTPLWVAEHLTQARIDSARRLNRIDHFHEESKLPASDRAYLSDYGLFAFDRGHMAPNGDMATRAQQFNSFSLANIVPQSPWNNREVWRNLEEATRVLARKEQDIYVVTGPAFLGDKLQRVGRVLVPTHVFKLVYFPRRNLAAAYFAPNDESGQIEVISLATLEQRVNFNLLPTLSLQDKQDRATLPLTAKSASRFLIERVRAP